MSSQLSDSINTRATVASNTTTFVVRTRMQINMLHVQYTSDTTVGNRQVNMEVKDSSGNLLWDGHAGAVQAASLVYHYSFLPGIFRETTAINNELQIPMPMGFILEPNWTVTIRDTANISGSDSFIYVYQGTL